MPITRCLNCEGDVTRDALVVTYRGDAVAAVCHTCLETVRKPRITLVRSSRAQPFVGEQFSCVEVLP